MLRRKKPTYKLVPADKFSAQWKRAKAAFFQEAERKKPKVTKELTLFGKKIATYKAKTGIEGILKAIEINVVQAYTSTSARTRYETGRNKLAAERQRFFKELNVIVTKAPEGVEQNKLDSAAKKLEAAFRLIERDILKEDNKLKNAIGETQSFKLTATGLVNNIGKRVAGAQQLINRVRTDPRPEVFNKDIEGVARGLTQQIGNIDKLTDMGYEFAFKQPTEAFERLAEWANEGREVPEDGDRAAVLHELSDFEEAVDMVANWAERII